ncbi:MAG: helix-turn-helix transcriptional regulator [Chitinophagaceae bacterium]|jgi:putative transcriptional regulator|nr:helix-turn-helix transcriptional regulator [Chitinophagaceae bacterium]MBK9958579.1 helix-turn-helix transcriptional regulator [Chitinophagaceae bacterium]
MNCACGIGYALFKVRKVILKELRAKLKTARHSKGLPLRELGYRIDKGPPSISRVEMGDINPTYLYLLKLCEGLEISLCSLLKE